MFFNNTFQMARGAGSATLPPSLGNYTIGGAENSDKNGMNTVVYLPSQNKFYAGGYYYINSTTTQASVWSSTDGLTWTSVYRVSTFNSVRKLIVVNGDIYGCGPNSSLLKYTVSTNTWQRLYGNGGELGDLMDLVYTNETFFVKNTVGNVFKSSNFSETGWTQIATTNNGNGGFMASSPSSLLVYPYLGSSNNFIWRSTNFTNFSQTFAITSNANDLQYINKFGKYFFTVNADLYVSDDDGISFTALATNPSPAYNTVFVSIFEVDGLFCCSFFNNNGGPARTNYITCSTDLVNWSSYTISPATIPNYYFNRFAHSDDLLVGVGQITRSVAIPLIR